MVNWHYFYTIFKEAERNQNLGKREISAVYNIAYAWYVMNALAYRLFTPDNCLPPHSSSRPPPPTTPRVHVLFCHTQMPIIMSDYIKSKQFLLPHMRHRKMAFKLLSVRSLAVFICGLLLPSFAFSLFILVCCFFIYIKRYIHMFL